MKKKGKGFGQPINIAKYLFLATLLILSGCTRNIQDEGIPCEAPCPRPIKNVRVALALGTGGFRSIAHLGVLEVLSKEGIPIDLVVGSSAGSLIGAVYCDNPNVSQIKEEILELKKENFIEKNQSPSTGATLKNFLRTHLCAQNFEELKIPFIAVATNLNENRVSLLRSGPIAPAVLASCADPLVFKPVPLYGQALLDGGILEPVPVKTARLFCPKMVIAVNLSSYATTKPVKKLRALLMRCIDISFFRFSKIQAATADVTIHPYFYDFDTYDDKRNKEAYEAGKKAAYEAIPRIKAEMKCRGIEPVCRKP